MSEIDIEVPQTRTGYFVEQNLRKSFGSEDTSDKIYTLTISMYERQYSVGLMADDTSTRSEITSSVSYTLKNTKTGKDIFKDNFSETVTYDTSQSPFTGVISQQDAQERIAGSIAQKIQTNLAIYFHENAKARP
ncbi:MAG: LPS assembly lipoprotein LptE [Asticcacaulis sp.]